MKFEKVILVLFAATFFPAIPLSAQDTAPAPPPPGAVVAIRSVNSGNVTVIGGGAGFFATFAGGFGPGGGKTVTGAPFSAQEVTNSSRSLSDGNQINRNNTVQIYRDSAGRMRRDLTLSMIGPWSVSGKPKQIILITDPVNQIQYFLQPDKKIAYKTPLPPAGKNFFYKNIGQVSGQGSSQTQPMAVQMVDHTERGSSNQEPLATTRAFKDIGQGSSQTQSLGVQMIQGVEAQGREETVTIPAGAIGNLKPIVSTTQKWYSPDLQTYVLIKRTDPQFGKTTFQLENINRNEPPATLFQVPPGYTVQDGPPPPPIGLKPPLPPN